jgi:hypothetical protein
MGDEFQGTLFYSYYGGEKIAETLNQLNFDAMTIGNHEFDQGDAYLGQFVRFTALHLDLPYTSLDSSTTSLSPLSVRM